MDFNSVAKHVQDLFPNAHVTGNHNVDTSPEDLPSDAQCRISCDYQNISDRFNIPCRVYTQQYSELYHHRLQQLKPRLLEKCAQLWPSAPVLEGIQKLTRTKDCSVIIGVLYKDMKLKPSVLQEYLKDLELESPVDTFLSDTDRLYLEDDAVRIVIVESQNCYRQLPINTFVTGLVMACQGIRSPTGNFEVIDWTLPGISCIPRTVPAQPLAPCYLAILSGKIQLGRYVLEGDVPSSREITKSVVRVVIIGTTMCEEADPALGFNESMIKASKTHVIPPLRTLEETDGFLFDLACSVSVDVLPGPYDPTNYSWPQSPIHPALLPHCSRLASFQSVTNPYHFRRRCLCMSQQSVKDVKDFSNMASDIEVLKFCVEAQHLCPTAPDTLPCYPFTHEDPFCLPQDESTVPDIIVSGGHDEVAFKYYSAHQRTWLNEVSEDAMLILCAPSFSKTSTVVLVELNSLQILTYKF